MKVLLYKKPRGRLILLVILFSCIIAGPFLVLKNYNSNLIFNDNQTIVTEANQNDPRQKENLTHNETYSKGWEDRMMTNGEEESFEWWYLDGNLNDGSKISVSFHPATKDVRARLLVGILWPNGDSYKKFLVVDGAEFSASKETCNINIDKNYLKGDLDDYFLHLDLEDLKADLKLHRTSPLLNKITSCTDGDFNYCSNWFPSLPRGELTGKILYQGREKDVSGLGYHEHSWGNLKLGKMANYIDGSNWGRAWFDEYTVIFFEKHFPEAPTGKRESLLTVFIIKGDQILVQENYNGELLLSDDFIHPLTGEKIFRNMGFDYNKDGISASLNLTYKNDILASKANLGTEENDLSNPKNKRKYKNAYHRFTGPGVFEITTNDQKEEFTSEPIWEQFDFN